MNREQWIRLSPLLLMLVIVTLIGTGMFSHESKVNQPSPLQDMLLPNFHVPQVGSEDRAAQFTPQSFSGHIVVLNVFASWCPPCEAEHPVLMKLAQTGQVNVVGLAWKDKPQNIVDYLVKNGNPFQLVGVDENGSTTVKLGLTGVPETMVIDAHGRVMFVTKEPITEDTINNIILPLVQKLQTES